MSVFFKLRNYYHNILFIVILILTISFLSIRVQAQDINVSSLIIEGNKRISKDTIVSISKIRSGSQYSPEELNAALARLKVTNYFKTVKISINSNILKITVDENPTINTISFEGNDIISDIRLSDLIVSKERQTLSVLNAEKDANNIAAAYSDIGRISAVITPKIVELSDNRINLIFEILEGKITEVENITFTGNHTFSDLRLRGIIATKQAGILSSLIKSDTYVRDRLDYDKNLLQNFYSNKGFIDFEVKTSVDLTRSKDAFLIKFALKEGQQFRFGKIIFDTFETNIDENRLKDLNKIKNGSNFDSRRLNKLIEEIDIYLSKNGFNFLEPIPVITRNNESRSIDIKINLQKRKKIFVERIEFEGNSSTLDEVIRLQFDFVEGDPYDRRKVAKAIDRIRGLGYFSSVQTNSREGSSSDTIILEVKLIEKATGSIGLGAGFNSSDGTVFTFNINERNFLGKGQTIKLDFSSSKIEKQAVFGIEDPSFLGRNLFAGVSFGQETTTPSSTPLKTEKLFIAPKIGFPLSIDSNIFVTYRFDSDKTNLISPDVIASPLIKSDVGNRNKSGIILSYKSDKTNSIVNPTAGYNFKLSQELNGLAGDTKYAKSYFDFKTYKTIFRDDIIFSSKLSSGVIFGNDANINNRFFLGGDRLKGFRRQGIGPVDNTYIGSDFDGDPLGGKMFAALSLEASFPIGVPEEYGIFGGIFIDTGSVWGLDNTDNGRINDSALLRSATGVSLFWDTLIGPLRFNFSRPIKKEEYDVIENFRFTVDTRF